MSSTPILGDVTNRLNELNKILEGVAKEASEITKQNFKIEVEIKLRRAKLKGERLQALALLARSRAVLAETELLIAENELYTEVCDLKRKCPISKEDLKSPKKIKASSKQESKSKSSQKLQNTSKSKSSESKHIPQKTPKTAHVQGNKENSMSIPQKGKQIKVINEPPFRNVVGHKAGYITPLLPTEKTQYDNNRYNYVQNRPTFRSLKDIPAMFKACFESSNKPEKRDGLTSTFYNKTNLPNSGFKGRDITNLNPDFAAQQTLIEALKVTSHKTKENGLESPVDISDYNCKNTNGIFDEIMRNKLTVKIEDDEDDEDSVKKLVIDLEGE